MRENALIIVAKRPSPGHTKTRLVPPLSYDQATSLYECCLKDTVEIAGEVPGVVRHIAFSPPSEREYFGNIAPGFDLFPQTGDGLGERLANALSRCLAAGFRRVVIAGSDCPGLPAAHITCAFDLLRGVDVVLGPCDDGGYYLIGVTQPQPRLLKGVKMSTSHVLKDTVALAESSGLKVALGPAFYDVDTADDLRRLVIDLRSTPDATARHTRAYLSLLETQLPAHLAPDGR